MISSDGLEEEPTGSDVGSVGFEGVADGAIVEAIIGE